MRDLGGGLVMYLLAAVVADPAGCDQVREDLLSLRDRREPRLHWHTQSDPRRDKIASAIGQLAMTTVVVVGTPLSLRKQERGRRICMEALYPHLHTMGVRTIYQETRTAVLNRADREMVAALRGTRALPPGVRVEFLRPSEEPMLWIPDAVAGAVGAARAGRTEWLMAMQTHHEVEVLDIPLR